MRLLFPHPIHCACQNEMSVVEANAGSNHFIRCHALLQCCVGDRHCSLTIPFTVHATQTAFGDALLQHAVELNLRASDFNRTKIYCRSSSPLLARAPTGGPIWHTPDQQVYPCVVFLSSLIVSPSTAAIPCIATLRFSTHPHPGVHLLSSALMASPAHPRLHAPGSHSAPDQTFEMQSSGRFSDGLLVGLGNPSPRPLHEVPHHAIFLRVRSGSLTPLSPSPHRCWGSSERRDGLRKRDPGRGRRKLEEDGYGRFQRYGSLASAPTPQFQIV
jgi:hypothetical protein